MEQMLIDAGFHEVRQLADGRWVGLQPFLYTWGLMVNLTVSGYEDRYCYPDRRSASAALDIWDGQGLPSGPWIKRKGASGEMVNPATFRGIPVVAEARRSKSRSKV